MTCGSLGCGRPLYGGLGGNGHGLHHFNETGHTVNVKLGTITPEGGAGADFHIYPSREGLINDEI
jgi:ubiquitin carboxyl-terminal hydrolase 5/13